jgi:RecJ-like exonuclease
MSVKLQTMSDMDFENYLFYTNNEGKDICSNCNEQKTIVACNKCGDAICQNPQCSKLFPHYNNTLFAICNICEHKIGQKFKEVIEKQMVDKMVMVNLVDHDKLRLLKKKIEKKRQQGKKNRLQY